MPASARTLALIVALAAAYGLGVGPAATYSSGAPVGFAGDFETNGVPQVCTACHTGSPLNSGDGSVGVDAPTSVAPGETIRVRVTVDNRTPEASAGSRRQGFQAVVVDAATREPVGQTALVSADTKFAGFGAPGDTVYVTHSAAGTAASSWAFDWTAPSDLAGPVRLYVAANAADGDGESSGDRIYATSLDIAAAGVAAAPAPAFDLSGPSPNPATGAAVVDLTVGVGGPIEVAVVDGRGRRVRAVASRTFAPGTHRLGVEVGGLAAGTYFVVATGPAGRRAVPLAISR